MNPIPSKPAIPVPAVWYIAAGYKLPAGIEAYLLHYATELRSQGFDPRIIVFEPLPKVPHRFLVALWERGIPIESLYERVGWKARVLAWTSYLPWVARGAVRRAAYKDHYACSCRSVSGSKDEPRVTTSGLPNTVRQLHRELRHNVPNSVRQLHRELRHNVPNSVRQLHSPERDSRTSSLNSLMHYWLKRLAVRELKRRIKRERPDIIHVKGRIICEALDVLPSDRTLYQHALMGTRDPSWADNEADAFRVFLNRIARVLVQGQRIAETFARSFHINRPIDVVFTMVPDELLLEAREKLVSCQVAGLLSERPASSSISAPTTEQLNNSTTGTAPKAVLHFGILCRFTEQKGISYILEALRMFREKYGQVDFTFAGQGPLEEMIRRTVGSGQWTVNSEQSEFPCSCRSVSGRDQLTAERSSAATQAVGVCEGQGDNGQWTEGRDEDHRLQSSMWEPHSAAAKNTMEDSPVGTPVPTLNVHQPLPIDHSADIGVRIVPVISAADILKNLDVFVHPGLDDAMPVSIVEALMCGVPCIVSDVGASPELVRDGVEGRVIQPASAAQILEAMESFAKMSESEMAGYKERARRRYKEACMPAVVGAQVAEIYREVIGKCVRRDVERHLVQGPATSALTT